MNKKKTLLMLCVMAVLRSAAQINDPAPYCAAEFMFNYNMWNYISIAGTKHQLGAKGSFAQANRYTYYNTVNFPAVPAGTGVEIELMPYSVDDMEPIYFGVFIDYNKNNTFESSELLIKNSNTTNAALPTFGAPATAIKKTITLPATLQPGTYRLRLIRGGSGGNYSAAYQMDPCISKSNFAYGSSYDFNFEVKEKACQLTVSKEPANLTRQVGNTALFVAGSTDTGITYTWQQNTGSGFQNLSNSAQVNGVNNDSLLLMSLSLADNNKSFRCIISRANCLSDTSAAAVLKVNPATSAGRNAMREDIRVYPNPVRDLLNIQIPQDAADGPYTITLHNALGQQLYRAQSDQRVISISKTTVAGSGLCYVSISNADASFRVCDKVFFVD